METTIPAKTKTKLSLISVLSLVGAIVSIWQTNQFFTTRAGLSGFHSFCNIGQTFDCTTIEMSPYAELFKGFPLSAIAIAGYLLILGLSLFAMNAAYRRSSRKFLILFSTVAVLFSAVYLFIMVSMIGKLCLLCLGVDAVNVLLFVTALTLPKDDEKSGSGMGIQQVAGLGVAALFIGFLFAKGMDPQAEMKKEDLSDSIDSVMNSTVNAIQIPTEAPVIGNPNAKITIVKFSDYECPACRMAATAIHPLMKRYANDVKFVFVNFPLDSSCNTEIKSKMHESACEAAAAAICAQEQGKFLEAYETLFENQHKFKTEKPGDLVASIPGIDGTKLKSCMALPSTGERIKRDVALGVTMKIRSTPTFFFDGKRVEGGLPTNLWMEIIDRTLKQ